MQRGPNQTKSYVRCTASQLAEMGYCERKMLLRLKHGPRTSPSRLVAQERGMKDHAQFFEEGRNARASASGDSVNEALGATATKFQHLRRLLAMLTRLGALICGRGR